MTVISADFCEDHVGDIMHRQCFNGYPFQGKFQIVRSFLENISGKLLEKFKIAQQLLAIFKCSILFGHVIPQYLSA